METNFSPSINIVRDLSSEYNYIPTQNSIDAYETISKSFKSGVHSYNLIGSYGTGKSAFLLAFYKHLNKQEQYFTPVNGQFNGCSQFKFLNVVGKYESLVKSLSEELGIDNNEDVVYNKIKTLHTSLKKKKKCLVIVVDEFGKVLEYAAKNNPEKELYFIQRIAEFANDKNRNILFLTTLHQNFDAYSIGLEEKDRKEWEKVKGRIKELPFNEPVEQLLNLAASAIRHEYPKLTSKGVSKGLLKLIKDNNLFKLRNNLDDSLVKSLSPIDPIAASSLLISLQKYGQNERSLFGFIVSNEPQGLKSFIQNDDGKFFNTENGFDYLTYNFSSYLHSKGNPDFFRWRVIYSALDKADNLLRKNQSDSKKIIKAIGLIDLLLDFNGSISKKFIELYSKEILLIKSPAPIIRELESKGIIKYQSFRNSYGIFEGTDIDIERLIAKQVKSIGQLSSIEEHVSKYFKADYEVAKAVSYKIGTPRLFEYKITTEPIKVFNENRSEIDGIINIVFNPKARPSSLKTKIQEPILHCLINDTELISSSLLELNVIEKILKEEILDKVARGELEAKLSYLENDLKKAMEVMSFSKKAKWYSNGKKFNIESKKHLNKILSSIAEEVYFATPTVKSEHINKSKLTGSAHTAKKALIKALIQNWDKPMLGFDVTLFPPERSIYHSLLENSGIHYNDLEEANFQKPTDKTYKKLWDASLKFIEKTKKGKRSVSEFVDLISNRPFKLKDGLAEFWVITFLFIHRDEYALYRDGIYVPNFSFEVGELIYKKANSYSIKAIEVDGVRLKLFNKYRLLIQKDEKKEIKDKGFQEIAKPFLTFYKQLSPYTKSTNKNLSKQTVRFRETLLNAKELEKTFFDDIPKCFNYDLKTLEKNNKELKSFSNKVQKSIKELRLNDERLLFRIKDKLSNYLGIEAEDFLGIKSKLKERYSNRIDHLLNPRQRTLIKRIESPLDEEKAWLSSLSQALIGKQTKHFTDEDELVLFEKINKELKDLDALVSLSEESIDPKTEVGIKYQIYGTDKSQKDNQIVLNKKQLKEVSKLKKEISSIIKSRDKTIIEGTLLELLKSL